MSFSVEVEFDSKATKALLFTDYPNDRVPIRIDIKNGDGIQTYAGTGGIAEHDLDPAVHHTSGTVWRLQGRVSLIPGYVIDGNPVDPLTFYFVEGVGAVYLLGQGLVARDSGVTLFSSPETGRPEGR
jgi:hypothetical protein